MSGEGFKRKFAAIGVFWGKDLFVEVTISLVGFVSSLSVWYSLILANRALWNLVDDWQSYEKKHNTQDLPPIFGLKRNWPQFCYPWVLVPPVISAAWIAVLFRILTWIPMLVY